LAKTSILSHVIIMETTKPNAACVRNLGAHARKTDPGLNSPEQCEDCTYLLLLLLCELLSLCVGVDMSELVELRHLRYC